MTNSKITKKSRSYSQWYTDIIALADLADNSSVQGCMIIKPNGYAIWENIHKILDGIIQATGANNVYFPLFIPKSFLEREAKHAEGFAKECAVVTHRRLQKNKKGKLVPVSPLEEPLVIRPTSETIISEMFSKWIQSYRDLPLLINQWANTVRWEIRTHPFLRTTEFLWQEGHTVHAEKKEAEEKTFEMLEVYRRFVEEYLAIPVISGRKTESKKFAGADYTTTIEAMMQDGKALQVGASHMLGRNFAEAFDIKYSNKKGKELLAWQTSWSLSTRIIGAVIMVHSDDQGLVLPPKIAPLQIVIIPIWSSTEEKKLILEKASNVKSKLEKGGFLVFLDERDMHPGPKFFDWEHKGVPLRIEIGPKEVASNTFVSVRRDVNKKEIASLDSILKHVEGELDSIQKNLFNKALTFLRKNTHNINSWDEFTNLIPEIGGKTGHKVGSTRGIETSSIGCFLLAHWCGDVECETIIKQLTRATVRCIPFDQAQEKGKCVLCGKESKKRVIFAKSY